MFFPKPRNGSADGEIDGYRQPSAVFLELTCHFHCHQNGLYSFMGLRVALTYWVHSIFDQSAAESTVRQSIMVWESSLIQSVSCIYWIDRILGRC